jgi:putative aldouronate transport system permease protein
MGNQRNTAWRHEASLHVMMAPGMILLLVFSYGPMVGIVMAFQKYSVTKGFFRSPWAGMSNFAFLVQLPDVYQVLWNTVFIAFMKIVTGLAVPIILALLLNELRVQAVKRTVQTVIYLPYFLSWVILGGILIDILSPSTGIVNKVMGIVGIPPFFFLGSAPAFPFILVASHVWKEAGFGTIIYLAALTGIDPTLYEAAVIDGADRWRQTRHITIPGITQIAVLMMVLSLGDVLNAGFDQVFNLYSPMVYSTGDILDTMVYRMGLVDSQYSLAAAVGLFKSVVSAALVSVSYKLADAWAGYRVL